MQRSVGAVPEAGRPWLASSVVRIGDAFDVTVELGRADDADDESDSGSGMVSVTGVNLIDAGSVRAVVADTGAGATGGGDV